MAKVFDQEIDIATPWDGDDSTGGKPVAGRRVEEVLKRTLQQLSATKFAAQRITTADDGMATLRFFGSENDAAIWEENPDAHGDLILSQVSFYSQPVEADYTMTARVEQAPESVMIKGASNTLRFTYNCYFGSDPTDVDTQPGTATVRINNSPVAALTTTLTPGGQYSLDIGPYLTQENNRVSLTVANAHGKSRTWDFNIKAVEILLTIDESFVESAVRDSNWALRVGCHGATAAVHVKVDGREVGLSTITNSTFDFVIDADGSMNAGVHRIEVYAENSEYGITTSTLRRTFVKRGLSAPSLCISGTAADSMTLYDTIDVPYFLYAPSASPGDTAEIAVEVRDGEDNLLKTLTSQSVSIGQDLTTGMQRLGFSAADEQYLSAGRVRVVLRYGSITATHEISITPAEVTLTKATECKVNLSAAGKSNTDADAENWTSTYNGVETCRVVRSENFRLTGDNGFGGDSYLIKSGKCITLDGWLPFAKDFGANATNAADRTGRTIEFELEARNCTNSSAKIIECMSGGVGFEVYADRAVLSCSSGRIETPFSPEQRIRIGFVIDGTTTHCVNQMIDKTETSDCNIAYLYVNGVIVRMMDYGQSSWRQSSAKNIVIGSDDCDVALYTVNGYDKALDHQAMIGNYAYDTPALADKIAIAKRNDVLNSLGAVDFAKTLSALPNTPYIIWEMPTMPTSKSDPVASNTEFVNPRWVEALGQAMASFDCREHDTVLDGTSSLSYPDPYKNFGATYNGTWTLHLGDVNVVITDYSITAGIEGGEVDFVHKVNFASSEGIGNILAMNLYQKVLLGVARQKPGILTPAQQGQDALGDVAFRHSLSGFPEIGWLRSYDGTGAANLRFLSLFNFINNKYSPSIFGLTNDGTAELWEVEDNVNFFSEELHEGVWNGEKWVCKATDLYYARVPRFSPGTSVKYGVSKSATDVSRANSENASLRRIHNWLYSCNPHIAERYRTLNGSYRQLDRSVTYGDTTYTQDTPSYRYAKFYAEKEQYLNLDSVLMYALFCEYLLGTDSFDKNMTLAIINGKAWLFLRDTDTICRYDNLGRLMFKAWHEWNDSYDVGTGETGHIIGEHRNGSEDKFVPNCSVGSPVFNGRLSALFDCVFNTCRAELKSMYAAMRSSGLNAADILAMYDSFRDQWCEALYNADGMGYANTGRFDMAHGDKRESFRDFFRARQLYMDSKYNADTSTPMVLRLWGSGNGVALRYSSPIYARLNWGAGEIEAIRNIAVGTPSLFQSQGLQFQETTVSIYNADRLTGITSFIDNGGAAVEDGLQGISTKLDVADISNCQLLKELVLDYSGREANERLSNHVAQIGNSIALERLVVRNCPNINCDFNLKSERIVEVDLRDTSASGLSIPETDSLQTVHLGADIRTLRLSGMRNLTELTLQGFDALNSLSICDCPNCDTQTIVEQALVANRDIDITMHGIDWHNFPVEYLERLADMHADLTGDIALRGNMTFALKTKLTALYGDIDSPDNPLRVQYATRIITSVEISGDSYFDTPGNYQMVIIPDNPVGNNIKRVEWSMTHSPHATIDAVTGVLTVTNVTIEEQGDSATITLRVTLKDDTDLIATHEVGFYPRACKVGDLVYADGSYSDKLDAGKTVVGICFYINPYNNSERLCFALKNVGNYSWGLRYIANNDTRGFSSVNMEDRPDYSCFDVPNLPNIYINGEIFINKSMYRDETATGDADGYKIFPNTSPMSQIGFEPLDVDLPGHQVGERLPLGLANTLKIVTHRNIILTDSGVNFDTPEASTNMTMYHSLMQLMHNVVSQGGAEKYRQFYYPAASLCNAYEPSTKSGEILADCFKQGKWFLPAVGDLCRIYWIKSLGFTASEEVPDPPLKNAYDLRISADIFSTALEAFHTSTEANRDRAFKIDMKRGILSTALYGGGEKNEAGYALPVAAF